MLTDRSIGMNAWNERQAIVVFGINGAALGKSLIEFVFKKPLRFEWRGAKDQNDVGSGRVRDDFVALEKAA